MALSARQRSKITPPNNPAISMATYCTPVTSPAMLPATSTACHTLATRNKSSPIVEVQRPDHTVRTARSDRGRKTGGSFMSVGCSAHPDAAVYGPAAHREVGRIDQFLAARIHQQARSHLVHRVAEREACGRIGETQRTARA